MINFGIRQSFDRIEQIEERFLNLKVPVEIALPFYWDIYEPIKRYDLYRVDYERNTIQSL